MKFKVIALAALMGISGMAAQANELPDGPHIVTSGTASVDAVPDIATLAIEVNVAAKDAATAKKQADERVAQYISFLELNQIAKKDIDQVKQILTNIIQSEDRILKDREMTVRLNELGASSINFVVRVWSNSGDLQNVYWDVLERIKREFDAAGISFPYPQMDVNFKRVKEDKAA